MTDDESSRPDLQPDFRADLDSLFLFVDSRMAGRRGALAPACQDQFVGVGNGQARTSSLDPEVTLAIRAAVREAVDDLFRERLAAEVRDTVEATLRQWPQLQARHAEEPRTRRGTLVTIRLRKALSW